MYQVKNRPAPGNPVKTGQAGGFLQAIKVPQPTPPPRGGVELHSFLLPLLHWWWALLIIPILSGAVAYVAVQNSPVYYQGRVLLGVGPPVKEVKNDVSDLIILRLTASYIDFVSSSDFLELVVQQAHSHLDLVSLQRGVVTSAIKGTAYFEVQFVDTDPKEVLNILGAIRDLLMKESPQVHQLRTKFQQDFLNQRKSELQGLVQARSQELSQLAAQPQSPFYQAPIDPSIRNIFTVRGELDSYTQELNELNQLTDTDEANQLQVVEDPHLLTNKLGAQPRDGAIAMGTISLTLVVCLIFLIEKIDPKIRRPYQVEHLLGVNILLVNPRPQKQSYELLAADLVVSAIERYSPAKFRLLCLHEKWTTGIEPALNNLGEALSSLGIICTRTGESNTTFNPPISGEGDANKNTGLIIRNQLYIKSPIICELISQRWPTSLQLLSNVIQRCDGIIIFCSLNKSYKQTLVKLRKFLDTVPIQIVGVVII